MIKLLILTVYCISLGAALKLAGEKRKNITDIIRSFRGSWRGNETENLPTFLLELEDPNNGPYFSGVLSSRIIPAVYSVAVVIGIPSNGIVLGALVNKIRTFSSAILYTSLATSNILVLLTLTFRIHYHLSGNDWVFGEDACRVVMACFYGNIYCSIHMHMCISFKRYIATVHPFTYRSLPKHLCTIWSSITVWAVFLIAMVPELLIHQSYNISELNITTCYDVLPSADKYTELLLYYKLGLICLGYFIPLLVTVFSYAAIVHQLNKSHHDWIYYIRMSTLVFIIFIVCFTPSNVFHFVHYIKQYRDKQEHLYIYHNVALCLCSLHCCLDPFLFLLMSRTTTSMMHFIPYKGKTVSLSI